MPRRTSTGRRIAASAAIGLALAGLLLALGSSACRSMPKDELLDRLAALPKNEPVGARGLTRREIRVELDGREVAVELVYFHARAEAPRPGRAPVVLVHGTPSTLFTWTETVFGAQGSGAQDFDGLARERDVYALEIAGHGVAPGDLSPYSFETCARFVEAALRGLELGPVHLVGSSYGGEFVWRAALNAPELVASVTLIDSSGYPRADGDWLPEEVAMRENSLADYGWLLNSRARIETALAPHFETVPPDRVEEFFLVCENAQNWRAMVDLARDENGARAGELDRLAAPTLVVWGADDAAYSLERYGARFAAAIPGARLVVLPATGHYPHEQRPREVIAALEQHFDAAERGR